MYCALNIKTKELISCEFMNDLKRAVYDEIVEDNGVWVVANQYIISSVNERLLIDVEQTAMWNNQQYIRDLEPTPGRDWINYLSDIVKILYWQMMTEVALYSKPVGNFVEVSIK